MAIAVTLDYPRAKKIGKALKMVSGSIAFDSSYPTGGEPANAAGGVTRHFKSCKQVICEAKSGYIFEWDATNLKILVRAPLVPGDGGAAGANNTLIVANNQVELSGTGAVNVAYPGPEVPNTSNLAALTGVRFVAYGY